MNFFLILESSKSKYPETFSYSTPALQGFCLAQKKDKSTAKYKVPEVPRGYRPKAAIAKASSLPKIYGKLDNTVRGLLLGERRGRFIEYQNFSCRLTCDHLQDSIDHPMVVGPGVTSLFLFYWWTAGTCILKFVVNCLVPCHASSSDGSAQRESNF